jgi:hypothetical protein
MSQVTFNVAEQGHIVPIIFPVDGNAGSPVTAQGFSMAAWRHASIIVALAVGATPTSILLVASTAASAGTTTALPFNYYACLTASGDVLGARTAIAATGITSVSATDKVLYVIEIDSAELPDGKPYLQLQLTVPGSSELVGAFAILSGARNLGYPQATVLV